MEVFFAFGVTCIAALPGLAFPPARRTTPYLLASSTAVGAGALFQTTNYCPQFEACNQTAGGFTSTPLPAGRWWSAPHPSAILALFSNKIYRKKDLLNDVRVAVLAFS
tara:strand:+ start:451 stop:774 length:324 start_codon:yes stop_codon:yes gene_type:complete